MTDAWCHRKSDSTQILTPSGKGLPQNFRALVWNTDDWTILLSTCSSFFFKPTDITCEWDCFPTWAGGTVSEGASPVGLRRPRVSGQQWFPLVCHKARLQADMSIFFFRMKRIWAVTFINGKTVILSSPRRNFWPSRKHSSQERKDCHWTE